MNRIVRGIVIPSITLLLFFGMQPVSDIPHDEQADFDAFLDESGLRTQLLELPMILLEQFEEEGGYFDEATKQKIRDTIQQTFSEELVMQDAREFLGNINDPEHMQVVRTWLNSPLTLKMNEYELGANSPEFELAREEFLTRLQSTPPDQSRVDTIFEFDELTEATYNTVKIITDLYLALIKTMNPYQTPDKQLDLNDTSKIRQSIMMQLLPVYENVTVAMNLFAYREVTDAELEEYISFYKTDSGQWFVDVSYSIFDFVIEKVTRRIEAETK